MGNATSEAPQSLFHVFRKNPGIRIFVETGTANGDTAFLAGDIFDTVITMEADRARYEAAHPRLSGRKGLLPLFGHSRELLPNLMPRLAEPALFWLAAHGPETGSGHDCPLRDELAAIAASPMAHLILIAEAGRCTAPDSDTAARGPDPAAVRAPLANGLPRDIAIFGNVLIILPHTLSALWGELFPQDRPELLSTAPHG